MWLHYLCALGGVFEASQADLPAAGWTAKVAGARMATVNAQPSILTGLAELPDGTGIGFSEIAPRLLERSLLQQEIVRVRHATAQ